MSAKPSVFAKIRAAVLALGQSERAATRKARLLETASFSDFKRLSPEQNVKLGLSPKARRYVLKDAQRRTKSTLAISARQFETKRRARAIARRHSGESDTSTTARRDFSVSADQRGTKCEGRDYPRGEQRHRGHQKAAVVRRGRSEQFAGQAAARNVASDLRTRRGPLPRHQASQARGRTYSRRRMAMVHRPRAPTEGPAI